MEKHEEKYCPKCNSSFVCKMGDISNCQCSAVEISEDTTHFLATSYYDCLCKNCLAEVDKIIKAARGYRFPTQKEMLVDGVHFYKENNYIVFTELYHTLRGHCCQSNCRHCVYGYKKQINS